ncbi:cell divison protein FtsY homolog [Candidatus Phytoplasma mali]|uniref:Cell divison protein FtsY homolog n=1 Tax=Phytoplasma mali (strain AT) TaxID=482235 RepID=B3R097_PHYMT|nr:signal recognition particle-docking protein FtsY [Candidatus Phytoplasma mali]CAP18261.1 cell divison protein FtsY homolog [Candidatus Phytoplasma mali]
MLDFLNKYFFKKKETQHKINFNHNKNDLYNFKKILNLNSKINDNLLKSLEILFIQTDISTETVIYLMTEIKKQIKEKNIIYSKNLSSIIFETMLKLYQKDDFLIYQNKVNFLSNEFFPKPEVYLFVGVNGVGKTTTIGKIAQQFKNKQKKVLLIAGDTFRSGAIEQLKIWGQRTQSTVFFKEQAKSPSNVIFEGLQLAKKENYDVVLCDTAGRLQNKLNLMSELSKIRRVILKVLNYEPQETFLVLDAMMGQNGIDQVSIFQKNVFINGVILTKLDGSSKGGLIFTIKHLYNIDIKYIGVGENVEDLIPFEIKNYILNFLKDFF